MRIFHSTVYLLFSFCIASAQQLPEQWVRTFRGQGLASDRIAAMTTDSAGNIYSAGYSGGNHGMPDAFAMKSNIQGDTLWMWRYDGGGSNEDYASDIVLDAAGNCYITGRSQGTTVGIYDCFTAKLLPSGAEAWVTRYVMGGIIQSYGHAVIPDDSGNVYVAGYTDPPSASTDWLVIKYNSAGVQQWDDVLNGPGNGDDEALDIIIASNGNPTACGSSYHINASGNINSFIKQYTPTGGTAWSDTWNNLTTTGVDRAYALRQLASGDILTGGETMQNNTSNTEAFAIRYNSSGSQQWVTVYTDSGSAVGEYLLDVAIDDSGNVFFAGTDYQDAYVTRINHNGTQGWRREWKGPVSNGGDVFHGLALAANGTVYATGRGVYPGEDYYGNGGLPNMILAAYSAAGDSLWTYRAIDSVNSSMGFAVTTRNSLVHAGGFVTDTAYVNENLYSIHTDTAGNPVSEFRYNGSGDAITLGQYTATDASGNVYCSGTVDRLSAQGTDIVLIKYDPAGTLLWERYYSSYGWNNDTLTGMLTDPSGMTILSISADSALLKSNYRLQFLKLDADGNFIDTLGMNGIPGSSMVSSMALLPSGGLAFTSNSSILGGIVGVIDPLFQSLWVAKIDSTPGAATRANSIDVFPNGDILVGGMSQSASANAGIVQRYDTAGNRLWNTLIDSVSANDEVKSVHAGLSGDVAFTGQTGSFNSFTAMTGKINGTTGSIDWRQVYNPNTTNEYGVKTKFTPAGNIAMICRGWTGFVARYTTVQYDNAGSFQWATVYNQTASDREPVDLLVDSANRIVTAGWAINGSTTNYDYVLAGYDAGGALAFENTFTTTQPVSFSWDQLHDLTVDPQGNFIVTGKTSLEFFNNYLFRMLTIKYGGTVLGFPAELPDIRSGISARPNPSPTGIFDLQTPAGDTLKHIRVYDLLGNLIIAPAFFTGQMDLSHVPDGIYMLVAQIGSGTERIRLVVSR